MFSYLLATTCHPFTVCQSCHLSTSSTRSQKARTFYEILDVPETATQSEVKNAFIKKTKELHPDVNPHDPELHKAFIKVSEAYTTLSSSSRRQRYDAKLNSSMYESSYAAQGSYSSGNPFGYRNDTQYHRNAYHSRQRASGFARQPVRPHPIKNPYNKTVIIGTLLFMLAGATVHFTILNFRHKKYQEHVEEASRKAHKAYSDAKERARTNGLQKQLELLTAHHAFYAQPGKTASRKTDIPESIIDER